MFIELFLSAELFLNNNYIKQYNGSCDRALERLDEVISTTYGTSYTIFTNLIDPNDNRIQNVQPNDVEFNIVLDSNEAGTIRNERLNAIAFMKNRDLKRELASDLLAN